MSAERDDCLTVEVVFFKKCVAYHWKVTPPDWIADIDCVVGACIDVKPLTVWITVKYRKFFKRWEYQTSLLVSWETCKQNKKQQLETDMEQLTGSELGKEYVKAVYCHPAYLTYMQSTSCKMPGWMKRKLESRLQREITITSDMQKTPPLWHKWRGTEEPLGESERGE